MIALVVGSLEVIKYKDDGDDENTVHMDFMFICVVDIRVLILILFRIRLNAGFYKSNNN